jgi:ABC-2 type transport system permease protein
MLKALAWKEWREQRPAILAGFALAAVLPVFVAAGSVLQDGGPRDLLTALPIVFLGGLWPLMAAAAGSITIANESEEGTLRFLLSRPISRGRIWLVKVGAALAAVAVVALFSLLVIGFVNRLMPPESAAVGVATIVGGVGTTIYHPLALVSATILLFSCSVLCSALLTRTLTAAAAGLALAMALMAGIFLVWSGLALVPRLEPQWLAVELVVASAAMLLASLIVFAWGELFRGGGTAGGAAGRTTPGGRMLVGALALVTLSAGLLPVLFASVSLSPAEAGIEARSVMLSGWEIVMTVADRDSGVTQIWSLGADAGGLFPLTGRHTFAPAAVPGGNWIAYLSRRGIAGGRGGGLDLRLVNRSGTEDRLVLRDVPAGRPLFFNSRVGSRLYGDSRVAFLDGNRLTVARLDGRGGETRDVSDTPLENAIGLGHIAGSGSDGRDWLLFLPAGAAGLPAAGRAATTLSAYHVGSGEIRPLYDLPAGWRMPTLEWHQRNPAASVPDGGWIYLPVIVPVAGRGAAKATSVAIELIDVAMAVAGAPQERAATVVPVHQFDVTWDDPLARRDFQLCAALSIPENRRWSDREDGRVDNEPQVLFGGCTPEARGDAAGLMEPRGGLIRLRGVETGEERRWPLPGDWSQPGADAAAADPVSINNIFLARAQDEILLDIRGVNDATSYALTIGHDGASRRFPPGWIPLGWLDRSLFVLQGGGDGTVAFAIGDSRTGLLRDLYPRAARDRVKGQ